MSKNYDNIRIYGDLDSEVFLAAKGSTLPTTLEDPAEPFVGMGWVSEDGVDLEVSTDVTKFKGWQGGTTLRSRVTSTEKTIKVQFLEETPGVTALFYGHGDPTITTDVAKVDLPEGIGTVERAGVIRFVDNNVTKLLCCESLQAGERGTVSHKNDDMTIYEITFDIVGASYILTNSPAYVEAGA